MSTTAPTGRRGRLPNSEKGVEVASQRLMLILTPSEQDSIKEMAILYQRVLTAPNLADLDPGLAEMLDTRHGGNPRTASSQNQFIKQAIREFSDKVRRIAAELDSAAETPS